MDIRRVGDTGIHTVEGNVAGARAAQLTKQADIQRQEYEFVKNKLKEENSSSIRRINDKFTSGNDNIDQEFRDRTIGLVTANAFREVRDNLSSIQAEELKQKQEDNKILQEYKEQVRVEKRKKMMSKLSFMDDEHDDVDKDRVQVTAKDNHDSLSDHKPVMKKVYKNPDVDTSFLPDKERDRMVEEEKVKQQDAWLAEQEGIKKQRLEVVYSYWDGSGHRRSIVVTKGTTIGRFLELVKADLLSTKNFPDLRSISVDGLLYVKEDLIIPAHYSFYDLIASQARGKSGPLFHFDVHDDVRLVNDIRIEKDESHPGKVVQRRYYEKNKHLFPASRWEVYNPLIERNSKYTISDTLK